MYYLKFAFFFAIPFCLGAGCSEKIVQNPIIPETPQVRIVSPLNNSILTDSATILVEATDDKGVVKVEIYINNQTSYDRTFYVEPYRYLWNTPQYQRGLIIHLKFILAETEN